MSGVTFHCYSEQQFCTSISSTNLLFYKFGWIELVYAETFYEFDAGRWRNVFQFFFQFFNWDFTMKTITYLWLVSYFLWQVLFVCFSDGKPLIVKFSLENYLDLKQIRMLKVKVKMWKTLSMFILRFCSNIESKSSN